MPDEKQEKIYMIDDTRALQETMESRRSNFPPDLKDRWADAVPEERDGELIWQSRWPFVFRERITYILGHEVMSNYQMPYMKKLAEIATRNGGDILEVGYGQGLATREIESWRKKRRVQTHSVIELNRHLAAEARQNKNLEVIEGDYTGHLPALEGRQFDAALYDGYPLKEDEMHRDGIIFIERLVKDRLLKPNGILTFYANATKELGQKFRGFLTDLGFTSIETEKVLITPPKRKRQIWRQNYFLAPIARFKGGL